MTKALLISATITLNLVCVFSKTPAQEKRSTTRSFGSREFVKLLPSKRTADSRKMRIHVEPGERAKTGNGAINYYRAALLFSQQKKAAESINLVSNANQTPLQDLNPEDFSKVFDQLKLCLAEVEIATTRNACTWQTSILEGDPATAVGKPLPELPTLRNLHKFIILKARFAAATSKDPNFTEAIKLIKMANQLAIDVGKMNVIVAGLVATKMLEQNLALVDEISNLPNSPNFYDAIKAFPNPIVDLRRLSKNEIHYWKTAFLVLNNPADKQQSSEKWRMELLKLYELGKIIRGAPKEPTDQDKFGWTAARQYKLAIRSLRTNGMPVEKIESLPIGQAIAIHASASLDDVQKTLLDAIAKPDHQFAIPEFPTKSEQADSVRQQFINLLLPTTQVVNSQIELQRKIALCANGQLLRDFVATNEGKLPPTLNSLGNALPVVDPKTNKPFEFARLDTGVSFQHTTSVKEKKVVTRMVFQLSNKDASKK